MVVYFEGDPFLTMLPKKYGERISFAECASMLSTVKSSSIWEAIVHAGCFCQQHFQQQLAPDFDKIAAICLFANDTDVHSELDSVLTEAAKLCFEKIETYDEDDDSISTISIMQQKIAQTLGPWTKYLRLLCSALNELKQEDSQVVFYKVAEDLEEQFKGLVGKVVHFPTFVLACNQMTNDDENGPQEDGNSRIDTKKQAIFIIGCHRVKNLQLYFENNNINNNNNNNNNNKSMLLLPTTRFQVETVENMGASAGDPNLVMIHLREVDEDLGYPLLGIEQDAAYLADSHIDPGSNENAFCQDHKQLLRYLCHECGDKMVCGDCVLTLPCSKHSERVTLMEAGKWSKNRVKELMQGFEEMVAELQSGLVDIKAREEKILKKQEALQSAVKRRFGDWKNQLEKMEQSQLALIENETGKRLNCLKISQNEISDVISGLQSMVDAEKTLMIRMNEDNVVGYISALTLETKIDEILAKCKEKVEILQRKGCVDGNVVALGRRDEWQDTMQEIRDVKMEEELSTIIPALQFSILACDMKVQPALDMRRFNEIVEGRISPSVLVSSLKSPLGVCIMKTILVHGAEEYAIVAEYNVGRLAFVSTISKTVVKTIGSGVLKNPSGVCVGIDGNVLVTDNALKQILLLDRESGQVLMGSSQTKLHLTKPYAIACDHRNKRIFVTDEIMHRVLVLDDAMQFVSALGGDGVSGSNPGEFYSPMGICVTSKGELVVSDYNNHRVQVFREKTQVLGEYEFKYAIGGRGDAVSAEFQDLWFVYVDRDDRILVADGKSQRVLVFDGGNNGSYLGCIRMPGFCVGVCVNEQGRIICTDNSNRVFIC